MSGVPAVIKLYGVEKARKLAGTKAERTAADIAAVMADESDAMGMEMLRARTTRVVLAAAHLDHDPSNNRLRNLRSRCQRCHMLHDRPYHLTQRRITSRLRYALGDLFLGPYRRSGRRAGVPGPFGAAGRGPHAGSVAGAILGAKPLAFGDNVPGWRPGR